MPRVVDYELYELPPRWLLLRLETSDGRVGWGEPVVEGRARTVRTAVEELLETHLLGEDPHPVARHWQRMYRGGFYRRGPVLLSAVAGVDQALWDLRGKAFDAPAHELLGGPVRDRMRVYRWVHGDDPEALADDAAEAVAQGYAAVKLNATGAFRRVESPAAVRAAVDRVEAVRAAVGPAVDVAVDFHGRVAQSMAPRLAEALEPAAPMFLEEPVLPDHLDALPAVAAHTTTPIATGERVYSRFEFRELFEGGAVDVAQPDLSHAGGITESKKIADMAAAHDVALAPHSPLGPVAFAACLQVDAVAHNALIQEQVLDVHDADSEPLALLADPATFGFDDGFVDVPDGPGLGVEVDAETVAARAGDVDWHPPAWRHDDGSVAEW